MKKRARVVPKPTMKPSAEIVRGINLEVRGSELIAQAKQRIAWHTRNAEAIAAELRVISPKKDASAPRELEPFAQMSRRLDIARNMRGHEEHARFLTFVARNLKRTRMYHVTLQDLSHFEIMPKGSYL